jgi:DNA invertase Pin-like site-specific DNA recombinase
MKKVIELIRVSTEEQAADDRASIPAQRSVNRRTCSQYGLQIVRSFEISDVSGASVLLAPEIQKLLAAMQDPSIDGVVAREFSRLMRPENFTDYALLQVFVDTQTVLYLPEGPIDLTTKTGRLMGTIRAAIAGLERAEILERIWSAKEEKRRCGELGQSNIVLGYGVGHEEGRGFYYKPEAELVREAFRRFLAGNHSYSQLAKFVGVTPRGMHIIMRNPIWTGWRVIDKKRDMSPAGRYQKANGRQADRRKIPRSPEEIIRVRVIDDPLISEQDFQEVQIIMDLKQSKHWRSAGQIERRFTYNGFLTCSECGAVIHTAFARRDYYACKGRRTAHSCRTKYMRREKLELLLDTMFTGRLTDPNFLENCLYEMEHRNDSSDSAASIRRLNAEIAALRAKRSRVIDGFIDGVIGQDERDRRLVATDREIQAAENALLRETPSNPLDVATLIDEFAPLVDWEYWPKEQKRLVLATMIPDIRVADYKVESLGLNPALFSNENTRMGTGSLLLRA